MEFTRVLACAAQNQECSLVERFLPADASIRWEIEVRGSAQPWTTAITTALEYPVDPPCRFWTAWSDPEHRSDGWRDPLVPKPFGNSVWTYANMSNGMPVEGDFICIPIASVLEPDADSGLSIVAATDGTLLDLRLATTAHGGVRFTHTRHRIAEGKPVRLAMDLAPHVADWRGGLAWMADRYPAYFNPPNPKAGAMAGCGAYSADERHVDLTNLRRMSFRINWKCSEDFAYMGMFLPPMPDDVSTWRRGTDEPPIPGKSDFNSYKSLNDYSRWMREQGFCVLNYFNVTEFGRNMQWPAPPRKATREADLWKDPNDFLYAKHRPALLLENDQPIRTCYGAFAMDVGDPGYQEFMLEQARRHIDKLPDSSGICIDRMDWLRYYNRGDDGVSWVEGKPARSLYRSWRDFMSKLGPMMHAAGKVIFVNNHVKRLDLLPQVDGIFCEFCQAGSALNSTGLLTLFKPALGWTPAPDTLRPDPDAFFQRHLHMGVYPTAAVSGQQPLYQARCLGGKVLSGLRTALGRDSWQTVGARAARRTSFGRCQGEPLRGARGLRHAGDVRRPRGDRGGPAQAPPGHVRRSEVRCPPSRYRSTPEHPTARGRSSKRFLAAGSAGHAGLRDGPLAAFPVRASGRNEREPRKPSPDCSWFGSSRCAPSHSVGPRIIRARVFPSWMAHLMTGCPRRHRESAGMPRWYSRPRSG